MVSLRNAHLRSSCYLITVFLVSMAKNTCASLPEYLSSEAPVAASVEESLEPMEQAYAPERRLSSLFTGLKKRLQTAAPFWRDTELTILPRLYTMNRLRDETRDIGAAALGGHFKYRSGWWLDRIKLGVTWATSQKLNGEQDKGGSLLLKKGQKSFNVFSEAYLEAKLTQGGALRLYRQRMDLPYLNAQDSRMIPNTFEAYTYTNKDFKNIAMSVSHVTKMKRRNKDKFISMSEIAGFAGTDEPLTVIGARYTLRKGVSIGAVNQYAWEFMNTFYIETNAVWKMGDDLAVRVGGQYTDQRSVGDKLGGDIDTSVYGAKIEASYRNAILTLAYTSTNENSRIRNPFGGYPGYLSIIIKNFSRAAEDAWLVGFSYDFSRLGLPGLSTFINYAEGDTPDTGSAASPDQSELDFTIDYRLESGKLKRLWFRARVALVDQDDDVAGAIDVNDYRFIVNYEIPIL